MIDMLNFVNRATDQKGIVPLLSHICVHDGKLQASNSRMTIEGKCPQLAAHSFTVPAEKFIKAVERCKDVPKIERAANGTVKISSGRFRVTLPSLDAVNYPHQTFKPSEAVEIEAAAGFSLALRKIAPFISLDASRPWSLGACLTKDYFYATNNVTIVRTPVKWAGPVINLPGYIIQEILNIDEPILSIWASKTSVSFEYEEGWLRAQLYTDAWPDISKMFEKEKEFEDVPDGLLSAIEQLIPFCPDVKFPSIHFKDGAISTANGSQSAEMGFDWKVQGIYRAEVLQLVLGVATRWSPHTYPKPVFFEGDGVEGLMVGAKR